MCTAEYACASKLPPSTGSSAGLVQKPEQDLLPRTPAPTLADLAKEYNKKATREAVATTVNGWAADEADATPQVCCTVRVVEQQSDRCARDDHHRGRSRRRCSRQVNPTRKRPERSASWCCERSRSRCGSHACSPRQHRAFYQRMDGPRRRRRGSSEQQCSHSHSPTGSSNSSNHNVAGSPGTLHTNAPPSNAEKSHAGSPCTPKKVRKNRWGVPGGGCAAISPTGQPNSIPASSNPSMGASGDSACSGFKPPSCHQPPWNAIVNGCSASSSHFMASPYAHAWHGIANYGFPGPAVAAHPSFHPAIRDQQCFNDKVMHGHRTAGFYRG